MRISKISKRDQILGHIVFWPLLIGAFFLNKNIKKNQEDLIFQDYSFTKGQIISVSAPEGTLILSYKYSVGSTQYKNVMYPPTDKFMDCAHSHNMCHNKDSFYWVMYSSSKPYLSLIDLTCAIKSDEDPEETRNHNDFNN